MMHISRKHTLVPGSDPARQRPGPCCAIAKTSNLCPPRLRQFLASTIRTDCQTWHSLVLERIEVCSCTNALVRHGRARKEKPAGGACERMASSAATVGTPHAYIFLNGMMQLSIYEPMTCRSSAELSSLRAGGMSMCMPPWVSQPNSSSSTMHCHHAVRYTLSPARATSASKARQSWPISASAISDRRRWRE